jgi:hypothetical protein
MTHFPYDEWIFLDFDQREKTLSVEDLKNLQSHLDVCDSCRFRSNSWVSVEHELSHSDMVGPLPGFTERIAWRIEKDRVQTEKRQTLSIIIFSGFLVISIMSILSIMAIPLLKSPNILLWTMLYRMFQYYSLVDITRTTIGSFAGAFGGLVPVFLLPSIAVLISLFGVLWLFAKKQLQIPGGRSNGFK